ncbi:DNA-processing protein DprA [Thalassospira alkalitolerans]|uniref:DNA-processing protein DprA n=1 Tax=Thalassospira alkalitolerans TaxID=1293890 RepID=UPI0030ED18D2
MHLSPQAQAVMLLTVSLGKTDPTKVKPLSNNEWARFAIWLKGHDLEPSSLLKGNLQTLLSGWIDRSVSVARLEQLMGRGTALGLSLEKWQRAGLWILTRSDPEYPERLKRRLRSESPAVLFGSGNKALLNKGGIAVIGSRDTSEEDLAFTEMLGTKAATQGYSIVSGGARGVDQSAMLGALNIEGNAVGVLADSLLKSAMSAKYRKHIMSGDLVLTTPFNPEAGFNVGNAMARNRYIYCLADAAVVISSTPNKGGTWNGAIENLKSGWVPLWVKHNSNTKSGNLALAQKGAQWLPDNPTSLSILPNSLQSSTEVGVSEDLPLLAHNSAPKEPNIKATDASLPEIDTPRPPAHDVATEEVTFTSNRQQQVDKDFYGLFLVRMREITTTQPMKTEDIASHLELEKSQTNAWIKRGVEEGNIKRLTQPVRYQSISDGPPQASLFGNEA